MATPINNLPQNNQNMESNDMQSDDNSKLVSEILQEMNKGDSDVNQMQQPMYDSNTNSLDRQLDPNVNMMSMDNIVGSEAVNEPTMEMTIDTESVSLKDNILNMVKDPVIVSAITLLVFSPIVKNLLIKYMSKVYNSANTSMKWIGLAIQSLMVGILYFGVKQVV